MKRFATTTLAIGILCGTASTFVYNFGIAFCVFIVSVAVSLYFLKYQASSKIIFLISALFLLGVGIGSLRTEQVVRFHDTQLVSYVGESITVEGVVFDDIDARDMYRNVIVTADTISPGGIKLSQPVRILLRTDMYPKITYGDRIKVVGVLAYPKNFSDATSTGATFNYVSYLAKDSIWYAMSYPSLTVLSKNQGSLVMSFLLSIKNNFVHKVEYLFPEPQASLLVGILLGAKQTLGKNILEQFQLAGVSHIVVLSGYNIAIVAQYLMYILRYVMPRIMHLGGFVGILIFILFVGAQATVVRAGIMTSVALFASAFGKKYDATIALFLAAALMTLHNPYIVLYDPSFQLSFLATLGLTLFSERIHTRLPHALDRFGLREIIATTLAAEIMVIPFILYLVGQTSILSLVSNILIVGCIPFVMLLGTISIFVSYIIFPLAYIPASITYIALSYILFVVRCIASIPYTQVHIFVSLFSLIAMYLLIAIFYVRVLRGEKTNTTNEH